MGDVIGVDTIFPNPPCELGTAIRAAAAISGGGLEKELFAIFPELIGIVLCDGNCGWQRVA